MASAGRFWKPGHGTAQYTESKKYDLGDLDTSKPPSSKAAARKEKKKMAKQAKRGTSSSKGGARTTAGGAIRIASSKTATEFSSRLKSMKFMQGDDAPLAESSGPEPLGIKTSAAAAAASSSASWSLGLPAGPLRAAVRGSLRCVADDVAPPLKPASAGAQAAPASRSGSDEAEEADHGGARVAVTEGRASFGRFNKAVDKLAKERARASRRAHDAAKIDEAGVSDDEMVEALSRHKRGRGSHKHSHKRAKTT
jgi:hypothetical protein